MDTMVNHKQIHSFFKLHLAEKVVLSQLLNRSCFTGLNKFQIVFQPNNSIHICNLCYTYIYTLACIWGKF